MSKPMQRERRRRKEPGFRPLRRVVAMVSAHGSSAALGGFSGLAVGAVSGMMAGEPGLVAGALLGTAIGAAAGAAAGAGQREKRQKDAALDAELLDPSKSDDEDSPTER